MPRVHAVVARKAYRDIGVEKGERYYWWKPRKGSKRRSKAYPLPSQLYSRKYAVVEDAIVLARRAIQGAGEKDDMTAALLEVAEVARECASEYNDSADNIEGAFTGGSSTADDCREKAESLESFADGLDDVDIDDADFLDACEKCDEGHAESAADPDTEGGNETRCCVKCGEVWPCAAEEAEADRATALEAMREEAEAALDEFPL